MLNYRSADTLFRRASGTVACVSVLALTAIVLFLLAQGLPIFKDVPIGDFLFTTDWYPTDEPPVFGLGAMIVGSFAAAVLTAVIAVPLGVLTAAALHCAVPAWAARILKPVIELMAALPSVVIGFIGMVIVAPWLQETFNLPTGLNLFNAGLMLAFMCIPTIASISEDALRNVPGALREASLALGATRWETLCRVELRWAMGGIGTSVMLGLSRAIGETMVVLMVAGGAGIIPESIFDPVRPMTAGIAAEMAEAAVGGEHYHALYAAGLLLFLMCVVSLVSMLGVIFWNAMPAMTWEFFTEAPRNMMSEGGIWPCIVGTFLLAAGALVIALPLGVMSAVFLNEYNLDSPVITVIRLSIANLAGVPSIIFGLFGLTFFVVFCGFGVSLLSGILTLAVLSLPIIINTTETALKQIPQDWREASLALGATRFETIMKVILPNALPGILTGAILALARAAGETAAVMYTGTVFFTQKDGVSLFEPVMALPYHVYVMATSGTNIEGTRHLQYGTSLVLVALVFLMSLGAIILRERRRSR